MGSGPIINISIVHADRTRVNLSKIHWWRVAWNPPPRNFVKSETFVWWMENWAIRRQKSEAIKFVLQVKFTSRNCGAWWVELKTSFYANFNRKKFIPQSKWIDRCVLSVLSSNRAANLGCMHVFSKSFFSLIILCAHNSALEEEKSFSNYFFFASDRRRKIKRSFMEIKLMLFLRGKARWAPCHYGSFITGQLIDIFHSSLLVMPRK